MNKPTVLHLFSGAGGGALGFKRAGFRSVGNVDSDEAACRDLEYLTGETATVADLGTLSPEQLREITGGERPDVVFTSPPCRGFSGCLAGARSRSGKYQEMNSLAFRGIWLALEAWDQPPPLLMLENVPRIQSRGKKWLAQIEALLHSYGYAVHRSTHDCGVLGGLAQRRHRFLLVARHMEQVQEYLRVPAPKQLRTISDVLGELPVPLPGADAGPMHRLPRQAPMNWLRLACIPAGGDWRDLPASVALPPRASRQNGGFGVNDWDAPSHTVVGEGTVRNTWASVADPRLRCKPRTGVYGVLAWDAVSHAVIGNARVDNGRWALADPRLTYPAHHGVFGVQKWDAPSKTVIGSTQLTNGPFAVADPRIDGGLDELDLNTRKPCHLVIEAIDGTWHRPMTTLELAALQGFPTKVDGEWLHLSGRSHKSWRQRIGNAVPPPTAEAIARNCAATLAATADGTFMLSAESIWVDRSREEGVTDAG